MPAGKKFRRKLKVSPLNLANSQLEPGPSSTSGYRHIRYWFGCPWGQRNNLIRLFNERVIARLSRLFRWLRSRIRFFFFLFHLFFLGRLWFRPRTWRQGWTWPPPLGRPAPLPSSPSPLSSSGMLTAGPADEMSDLSETGARDGLRLFFALAFHTLRASTALEYSHLDLSLPSSMKIMQTSPGLRVTKIGLPSQSRIFCQMLSVTPRNLSGMWVVLLFSANVNSLY